MYVSAASASSSTASIIGRIAYYWPIVREKLDDVPSLARVLSQESADGTTFILDTDVLRATLEASRAEATKYHHSTI